MIFAFDSYLAECCGGAGSVVDRCLVADDVEADGLVAGAWQVAVGH